jgi:2-iminoacetate synthase ThiH
MLSPKAIKYLEIIAQEGKKLTEKHFGNTVMLYMPLYISNYCTNECVYCGFNKKNHIKRKHLNFDEIELKSKEGETKPKTTFGLKETFSSNDVIIASFNAKVTIASFAFA